MRKISLSNFTHLNKIKWRIFIPVQKAWYVKKIARGGWSGFGKALIWDPSQMITCHPKKIPKFLLIGGVVHFCLIIIKMPLWSQIRWESASLLVKGLRARNWFWYDDKAKYKSKNVKVISGLLDRLNWNYLYIWILHSARKYFEDKQL